MEDKSWWVDNPEKYDEIVNAFRRRASEFGLKIKSKKYLDAQADFFIGASIALGGIPPQWWVAILRGEDICQP